MIEQQDVNAAKDGLIAQLINENLAVRAELAALRREKAQGEEDDPALDQAMRSHPSNGRVDRSLSVAPPSAGE